MTYPPLSDDNRLRDIALLLRERADLLDPPQLDPSQPDLLDRMDIPHGISRRTNAARLRVVADWFDERGMGWAANNLRAEADKETP